RLPARFRPRGPSPRGGAPPGVRRRRPRGVPARRPAVAAHGRGDRRDTRGVKILLDCDPGHDDAIALLLALASPEVDLVGVTTVHGNQTLEKTTVNALKLLEFVGRTDVPVAAGAGRPTRREPFVADYAHGASGMDGPSLPDPTTKPLAQHAVDFIAETVLASEEPITLVPTGPLTNIGLFLALHPDAAERVGG